MLSNLCHQITQALEQFIRGLQNPDCLQRIAKTDRQC